MKKTATDNIYDSTYVMELILIINEQKHMLASLQATIMSQQETITKLTLRVAELESQINKNSNNSSKPPSSDGLKQRPQSKREKSGKKPGGQPGHKGCRLPLSENPDEVIIVSPQCCDKCKAALSDNDVIKRHAPRQVLDIKKPTWFCLEYHGEDKQCFHCDHVTKAVYPVGVTNYVQYGPNVSAQVVYLHQYQHLPYERLQDAVVELLGRKIGQGTIANMITRFAKLVAPTKDSIREHLLDAKVIHADETGVRVDNKLHWLHVVCDNLTTLFQVHAKRGSVAIDANGIIPDFSGTLVHDCFSSYDRYDNCKHSICNAHIIRELIGIAENTGQDWTDRLIELLVGSKNHVRWLKEHKYDCMSYVQIAEIESGYDEIIQLAQCANPLGVNEHRSGKRGRVKKTDAQNLIQRMIKYKSRILRYCRDFAVPFDNNLAERAIRLAKIQQKISGCFRSMRHAEAFADINSFMSTVRKNSASVYAEIVATFNGNPFLVSAIG